VKASTYGLANIRRLVPMLIPATTQERTEDYTRLNNMYGDLIAQWARETAHVAVVVGGEYQNTRYAGQEGVIYTPVPRAKQQEAVRWLLANAFTTPTYLLDPEVLRRIEPTGSVERIRTRQAALVTQLLQDPRLSRMAEQSAFAAAGAPAYTIGDLLGDLRRGLFSEAAAGRATDEYRRNVQRAFVDQLDRLVSTPLVTPLPPGQPAPPPQFAAPPRPGDARALARAELVDLDTQLRLALPRTTDRPTRAHYQDLRARIDRILNPR